MTADIATEVTLNGLREPMSGLEIISGNLAPRPLPQIFELRNLSIQPHIKGHENVAEAPMRREIELVEKLMRLHFDKSESLEGEGTHSLPTKRALVDMLCR